jgi:hypothetical protein
MKRINKVKRDFPPQSQIVVRDASYLLNLEESFVKDVARLEIENDRLHELDVIMLRKVKRLEEELICANQTILELRNKLSSQ